VTSPAPLSPDHVGETINAIAQLRSDYKEQATTFQRAAEFLTAIVSNPVAAGVALFAVISWIAGSLLVHQPARASAGLPALFEQLVLI
jgi:uncharacterized membrane protein